MDDIRLQEGEIKNNVLVGKDGYLFLYEGAHNQFSYLSGKKIVSQESISNFHENIKNRKVYLANLGIQYKHVVFPSKPLLKSKYLPDKWGVVNSLFNTYYKDLHSGTVIYPLEELLECEKKHSTFLKYNSHITNYASLVISSLILKNLNLRYDIRFDFKLCKQEIIGGDLATMYGINIYHEEEVLIYTKKVDLFEAHNYDAIPGNTNHIHIIRNNNAINDKKVLIFGDSFFVDFTLRDVFKYYFREIVYIRSQYLHNDIVDLYMPDIVLTGNTERYLANVDSDTNANNILMELYGNAKYRPSLKYLCALKSVLFQRYYPKQYGKWRENPNLDNDFFLDYNTNETNRYIKKYKKYKRISMFLGIMILFFVLFGVIK